MRKQKKNSKNVKRLRGCAVLLLCGLLVCGMLAGCSKADVQKDTQNTGSPVEAEDILIQTSYGTLHYPGNWQEYVTIRQEQSGSAVLVTFETEIDGAKYELFRISIGQDEGSVVGSITDDSGTQRNVYLNVDEAPDESSVGEGEMSRYYAMQEDLNYLIEHLK